MRAALRRWLLETESDRPEVVKSISVEATEAGEQLGFSVIKAANGTLLKVSRYKLNPRGSDWTHELHIVKEGETVVDTFRRIYAVHSLEQK
jgi:hypothetical protein